MVAAFWYFKKLNSIINPSFVLINKETMTLFHFNYDGSVLQKSKIATGKNPGNKMNAGEQQLRRTNKRSQNEVAGCSPSD